MPPTQSKVTAVMAASTIYLACSIAVAQQPMNDRGQMTLQQCIADEAQKTSFSGVISVLKSGQPVIFANGLMAGPESAKMLPDAQFNIGSAGKMWTAVAVAQLVDAGKVSLDDAIGRHVSGLTPEASAVTIRQLLTHSGGLGNFFTPDNLELFERARTLAELKPLVIADKPMFTPGSRSEYSNSGFLLLGLMIENVSKKGYDVYLREHIFVPAGMTGSGIMPADSKIRAVGMTNFPEMADMPDGPPPGPPLPSAAGPRRGPPPPGAQQAPPMGGPTIMPPSGPLRPSVEAALMGTSAGGSFSTPSDMQRFFAALWAGKLTSLPMRDMLTSRQIELLPAKGPLPAVHYGLGFSISDYKGRDSVGHNGGAPGVSVATAAFPKDKVTAVIMTNRDPPVADMMLRKVQAMLFDNSRCI